MIKFKVGDKVKTLIPHERSIIIWPKGTKGEIVGFYPEGFFEEGSKSISVMGPKGYGVLFSADELELLPKYKTLLQLWVENGNNHFKAKSSAGAIIHAVWYDKEENTIVATDGDAYSEYICYEVEWQLYQEPEEENPTVKKSLSVEKCEHEEAIKDLEATKAFINKHPH